MKPDHDASLDFLRRWAPDGPWILTAISLDRKGVNTCTLREEAALRTWLGEHGQDNIYFHVNPATRDLTKKAKRSDVAALAWLHVDIDPRPGEEIDSERERALRVLREPPGDVPPPTVIVFSGGGYQGFWKLSKPVPIDGDEAKAEEAKRFNLQLEIAFGADNCHNVDRIMRLPGTINWPDAKKRKKGREPALAELVEWHDGRVYPIDRFTPAPVIQGGDEGFAGSMVQISGNVKRLASVDELPDKVSNRCRVVIVQGNDPDEPNKFPSRSEWLFYVCCELVRAGCEDDVIFSVITDPDFGISTSVLDKKGSAERYAIRQIERAHEEAINPVLRRLNERHAVIGDVGGKCRVISEVWDHAMGRTKISRQSFDDIRNRYMNEYVIVGTDKQGNDVKKPAGHWWLQQPERRQYDTMGFVPGREVRGMYNMWKGFACEARPGDCALFLAHVRDNICDGNEEYLAYTIGWMARAVQKPDSPGYTAIVLRGRQGTGKSFFAKAFGSLWGRHFMQVTDPKHLVGSFNSHLRDVIVLFGDEAFYAGDKKHESVLRMLITEEMITIEAKGFDAEAAANRIHLIMASNESWVVPAGVDERRFFALDVSDAHARDEAYFTAIDKELRSGGREALLHHLLTYDLSDFNVRNVPITKALQEQKIHSFSAEQEWWYSKLMEGRLLLGHSRWEDEVHRYDLQEDYVAYAQRFVLNRRGNNTRLGKFLSRCCPRNFPRIEQRGTPVEVKLRNGETRMINRPYFYVFPPLGECREYWDKHFGGPYEWPPIDETEDPEPPF